MRIAVLSRNAKLYSTKRLVEAARLRGHEATVIDHIKCSVSADIGDPKIFYNGNEVVDIDAVIPRIGSSVSAYGTAIVRQFEMQGVFSANSSIAIVRARDKLRSTQILSRHNVGIPKTIFANHPRDVDNLISILGGTPVIIKLLEGTQGIGVVLAETKKAAKSVIEAFYGINADIIVQEFIKEADGGDVRAFVVDGKVVGAMKRQGAEGEFRSNLHRGGKSFPVKLKPAERKAAILAAKALGLSIAGVDMLQSSRGPLIIEVNSSPGLEGIEKATEKDIASEIIKFVEKGAERKTKVDKVGA